MAAILFAFAMFASYGVAIVTIVAQTQKHTKDSRSIALKNTASRNF